MVPSKSSSLLSGPVILLLIVLVTSSTNWTATAQTDLVKSVCQSTDDYYGCVNALVLDPRTFYATNFTTLAGICLDLAVANTTEAMTFVEALHQSPSTSHELREAIDFCAVGYQHALWSFGSANQEVSSNSSSLQLMAYYDVMAASDWLDYCSDMLKERNLTVPEISTRNDHVRMLCSIGEVLTSDIIEGKIP